MVIRNRVSGPSFSTDATSHHLRSHVCERQSMARASSERPHHAQPMSPMELYPELFAEPARKASVVTTFVLWMRAHLTFRRAGHAGNVL